MIAKPEPKGVVQRWDFDGPTPKLFHRTRDTALMAATEWGWSEEIDDAWQFDTFNNPAGTVESDATLHAACAKALGFENVFPRVVSADEHHEQRVFERQKRHADAVAQAEASIAEIERAPKKVEPRIVNGRFAKKVGKHRPAVSPADVYEREERRGLA